MLKCWCEIEKDIKLKETNRVAVMVSVVEKSQEL